MKKLLLICAAISTLVPLGWAERCGNTCTGGPAKCGPCKKGANPFSPFSGSVNRDIVDLQLFGGIGEEKLAFKRTTTSRYKPGIPTPLGTGGSWRHNYYWNIVTGGTDLGTNTEIIHIDYPDGAEQDFHKETTSSTYLTGVSATQERIEPLANNEYYLWFADGRHLYFRKLVTGSTTSFYPLGFYDKYNNFLAFDWDQTKNRLKSVTEPGGRFIQITYSSVGNFPTGNVTFKYYRPGVATVALVGEFNNWGQNNSAIAMVNSNGTWTTTISLQLAASYQYKFLVNGNLWEADPNNPNTFPEGGPQTGNNSLLKNNDLGTVSGGYTPVTFTFTSSSANQVLVAGQFNNWIPDTLTKNGSTWTRTKSIPQGSYGYKFIVDGVWMQDPANSFTLPDGYGGYNSKLAVGPLDEAITQVQSSDGRFVTYTYNAYAAGPAIYSTLTQVNYGDGTASLYTYSTPPLGSRPTLASADDPRYDGAATKISYVYQNNGIEGFISEERSFDGVTTLARVEPSDGNDRSVTASGSSLQSIYATGQLTQETKLIGTQQRVTNYTYFNDGWGMLRSTIDANGETLYERTAQFGNVTKTTFPDTKWRQTTYTSDAKPFFPATERDEEARVTTYTRNDPNSRPTRIDYADLSYETFVYDNNNFGLLTSHRMRNGATESFTYYTAGENGGKVGDVKTKIDGAGNPTTYTYDGAGRVITVKDGRNYVTSYEYNDRGQLTKVYNPDHTAQTPSFRSFAYDSYGNRTGVTNELTNTWVYTYDEYRRLKTEADPVNVAAGKKTTYEYAGLGGASSCGSCTTKSYPTMITTPAGRRTRIEYNSEWEKITEIAGADTPDAATTSYTYDVLGRVDSMTDPRLKIWRYEYNNRNRRTKATQPVVPNQATIFTEWTYDGVGNKLTEKRSGDTVATVNEYDAGNRLKKTTDAKLQITEMTYDGAGNMLTLKDPRQKTYTFEYDGANRKRKLIYPDASTDYEEWTYDPAGNLATYRTRAGQVMTCTSDNRNRQTLCDWSDGTPDISRIYDAAGRLKVLNNGVSTISYEYDAANRLKSETQQIAAAGGSHAFTYDYNDDGKRIKVTHPSGGQVTYDYTWRNQVSTITADDPPPMATYTYDKAGNRIGKTLENNTSVNYVYDDPGRLTTLDHQKGAVSFAHFDYEYDTVNNRTARVETDAGAPANRDAYNYDAIDQLTEVKYNYAPASNTWDSKVTYSYDPAGNRANVTNLSRDNRGLSVGYTTNELNQYTLIGTTTLSYDNNGNLAAQSGWSYTYDAQNRLISATGSGATATMTYDGQNRCVSRTANGVVNYFYYDGWNLTEEHDAAGVVQARYIHGAQMDELLARITGSGASFYHQDALGSTAALTDNSGNIIERVGYDVFGTPTIKDPNGNTLSASSRGNRFLFTCREWLEANFYDYRHRTYSPAFGRFAQTDPLRFRAGDSNLYRYVANQITQRIDPFGLANCCKGTYTPDYTGPFQVTRDYSYNDCVAQANARKEWESNQECYGCDSDDRIVPKEACLQRKQSDLESRITICQVFWLGR